MLKKRDIINEWHLMLQRLRACSEFNINQPTPATLNNCNKKTYFGKLKLVFLDRTAASVRTVPLHVVLS